MLKLAISKQFKRDLFSTNALKKLHPILKMGNMLYGHGVGTNIHVCQSNLEMTTYVLKSANGNDIMP